MVKEARCIEHPDRTNIEWHHPIPSSLGGTKVIPVCHECHGKIHSMERLDISQLTKDGIKTRRLAGTYKKKRNFDKQEIIRLKKAWFNSYQIAERIGCSSGFIRMLLAGRRYANL